MAINGRSTLEVHQFAFQSEGIATTHLQAQSGQSLVVPDAHLLFTAEFKKSGSDLILTGEDGTRVFIHDYFRGEKRPDLYSPEGAVLTAEVVTSLAGAQAPLEYAQAGSVTGAAAIGRVVALTGTATALRNGVLVELHVGDAVQKGDVIQTMADSSIGINFLDGTIFNLQASARMVLDEFIFDPNGTANAAVINLVQGAIGFIAGKVAKTGEMRVETPVANLGIRGTWVLAQIDLLDGTTTMSILDNGQFIITDKAGNFLQDSLQGFMTVVSPNGAVANLSKSDFYQQLEQAIFQQLQTLFQISPFKAETNPQSIQSSYSNSSPPSESPYKFSFDPIQRDDTFITITFDDDNPETPPQTFTLTLPININSSILAIGEVTEDILLNSGGPLDFTGIDTGGDVNVSFVYNDDADWTDGALTSEQIEDIISGFSVDTSDWHYSVDTQIIQFLGAGEIISLSFDVTVTDGSGTSKTETVIIKINGINDAPEAAAVDLGNINEDGSILITQASLLVGSNDVDGDALTAENLLLTSGNGTLTDNGDGTWTFEPDADWNGSVSFGFDVSDGADSTANTASLMVDAVNDAPVILAGNAITRISVPASILVPPGVPGTDSDAVNAIAPDMSADGRYVVFFSTENVPTPAGGEEIIAGDVFLYDRFTGATTVLTDEAHISSGLREPGETFAGFSISEDGAVVVFHGRYEVTDEFGTHGENKVYIYDRASDTVTLLVDPDTLEPILSHDLPRTNGNGDLIVLQRHDIDGPHVSVFSRDGVLLNDITVDHPGIPDAIDRLQDVSISANGRYLTFWAFEQGGPPDFNPTGTATLYVYDRTNPDDATNLTGIATANAADDLWWASFSADGRFIVFQSDLNLDGAAGDIGGTIDVFVYDQVLATTTRVSADGLTLANGDSIRPSISADGRYVSFASAATNLAGIDPNGAAFDTFVKDLQTGAIERISNSPDVASDSSLASALSGGGIFAAFGSTASTLVPGDLNAAADVFIVDREGGTVGIVVEDASVSPSGDLFTQGAFVFSDADLSDAHTVSVINVAIADAPDSFFVPDGGLGTFTPEIVEITGDGDPLGQLTWTFTVNNAALDSLAFGEHILQTYTVQIDDNNGGLAFQDVIIALVGVNDAPTLAAVTSGSITEVDQSSSTTDSGLSGTLVGDDVDVETLTYGIQGVTPAGGFATLAGAYGTLSVNTSTGAYEYTKNAAAIEALDAGQTPSDSFTVTVSDGDGPLVTRTYTVNVTGADDAPPLTATGETIYVNNNPVDIPEWLLLLNDTAGGAVDVLDGAVVSLSGLTSVSHTNGGNGDGVLAVTDDSTPNGSFNYRVEDAGGNLSALAGVTAQINRSTTSTITGTTGADILFGAADNDTLAGGEDSDTYVFRATGDGNDIINDSGGTADRIVIGTLGTTLTSLNFERDNFDGLGEGDGDNDDLRISYNGQTITVLHHYGADDTASGPGTVEQITFLGGATYLGYSIASAPYTVNSIRDGTAPLILDGTAGNDIIADRQGGRTLNGFDGNDLLFGNGDDDILVGGSGADLLIGGSGDDTADYSSSGSGVTVSLVAGVVGSGGDAAGDVLNGIENLSGSGFVDSLTGNTGANVLIGSGGADTLTGGGGNDDFRWNATSEFGDTIIDFATGSDDFVFNVGSTGSQISVGNNNNTKAYVEGADLASTNIADVPNSGELDAEIIVRTDEILGGAQAQIDLYTNINTGALFVFDVGSKVQVWYDPNPSVAGGAILVTDITNISSITASTFDPNDFVFV